MNDVILVSHNDLDGVGSILVAEHVLFKNQFKVIHSTMVGNHEVDETILNAINLAIEHGEPVSIIVTDVTPSESTASKIDELLNACPSISLQVLDHHKHALWLNKYPWAVVEVERDGVKTSGTSLVMDFLHDEGYDIDYNVMEFAEVVRRYDTWDWTVLEDQFPKRVNDLLYIIGRDQFMEMVAVNLLSDDAFGIDKEYELLLDVEEKRINDYVKKKSHTIQFHNYYDFGIIGGKGYAVGVVTAERYFSELGNELAKKFDHLDLVAMIDIDSKKVSLRTVKDNVDLSVIAKALGGGGHPKAGGFPLHAVGAHVMLGMAVENVVFGEEVTNEPV